MRPRPWWLVVTFLTGFLFAMFAEELAVHWRNDELHVTAPGLHFLSGASLDRLKDAAAVSYDFQVSLWQGSRNNLYDRAAQRFVVSYALWEETFSVTKLGGSSSLRNAGPSSARERRSISHLTADAAEAWCIDNMSLPSSGIRPNDPLWLRLEIRAVDPRDGTPVISESGVSLTRLIELFSRPARGDQQKWTREAGPIRLSDLKRTTGRGS